MSLVSATAQAGPAPADRAETLPGILWEAVPSGKYRRESTAHTVIVVPPLHVL
ncbi:MAG: hypothetical protein ACO3JL_12100 [Myxococcota bacterium]